jgi:hypothetical protein
MNALLGALMPLLVNVLADLPPGVQGKADTIKNWVLGVLGWGAGIAFIAVGGVFCYAYFGGHGSSRAVRALAGVSVGCVLISAGSLIAKQLTQ